MQVLKKKSQASSLPSFILSHLTRSIVVRRKMRLSSRPPLSHPLFSLIAPQRNAAGSSLLSNQIHRPSDLASVRRKIRLSNTNSPCNSLPRTVCTTLFPFVSNPQLESFCHVQGFAAELVIVAFNSDLQHWRRTSVGNF